MARPLSDKITLASRVFVIIALCAFFVQWLFSWAFPTLHYWLHASVGG